MRLLNRIDLHVAYVLLLVVPIALFSLRFPWVVLPVVLIPQGMVLTRFGDQFRAGHKADARAYLFSNQLFLLAVTGLTVAFARQVSSG